MFCTMKSAFTFGTKDLEAWRKLYWTLRFEKLSLKMVEPRSLLILKISAARTCGFLIWIGTDLSVLSLYTMRRHLSCKWFILLFIVRLWNIHIKEQHLNCDIKSDSLICVFFQNSCSRAISSKDYLLFELAFLKHCLNVCWTLDYNQLNTKDFFIGIFSFILPSTLIVIFSLPLIKRWHLLLLAFIWFLRKWLKYLQVN